MRKKLLSTQILHFIKNLEFDAQLPADIHVINPFRDNPQVPQTLNLFYKKYYSDSMPRNLILGINPGRLGAGATGIPFTDTKRLATHCGITLENTHTHEPSSDFVYRVIDACGGPDVFYRTFYISSICPLGFVITKNGKSKNFNYYDHPELLKAVRPFAIRTLRQQINFGMNTDVCFCFGTGKNFNFIESINNEFHFFKKIIALEHPRYIMQYKSKEIPTFIEHYLTTLHSSANN
jgi:hypothetical protein